MPTIKLALAVAGLIALPAAVLTRNALAQSSSNDTKTFAASQASKLKVKVPFGDLIVHGGASKFEVRVKRWIERKDSAEGQRWVSTSRLETSVKDGVLLIEELPYGKRNNRDENHSGNFHPHYELTVSVPNEKSADFGLGAGNVKIDGAFGDLVSHVGAGSIKSQSISANGTLDLHIGAGDIDTRLTQPLRRASKVGVGTGEIRLSLPSGSDADVSASVGMGEISGLPGNKKKKDGLVNMGDHRKASFGRGGVAIDLHVGVGSIDVSGPNSVSMKESDDSDDSDVIARSTEPGGPLESIDRSDSFSWSTTEDKDDDRDQDDDKDMDDHDDDLRVDIDLKDSDDWADSIDDLDVKVDRATQQALKQSQKAMERSMKDAHREIERALRELDRELGSRSKGGKRVKRELGMDIEKIVREALLAAKDALRHVEINLDTTD